jgi:hypothetical protein
VSSAGQPMASGGTWNTPAHVAETLPMASLQATDLDGWENHTFYSSPSNILRV